MNLRRWFRKLCTFYKIKTIGVPQNLSDLIPQINHLYNTCVTEDVRTFYSRTDAFKCSFFQYTVLELNKLVWNIKQSKTLLSFRNSSLKTDWPIPKPIYNLHNHTELTLLNTLRLGPNHLIQNKFNHNFRDCVNPLCPCSLEIESTFDFFSVLSFFHRYPKNIESII